MNTTLSGANHSKETSPRPPANGKLFHQFARASARTTGHPLAFGLALGLLVLWILTGPIFRFSDTWQLIINTATSVATFLMVFLIQNTQNRDNEALQLKLDELIRANRAAHNALLDIEELCERELDAIKSGYERLAGDARRSLRNGETDLGLPFLTPSPFLDNAPTHQPADGAPRRGTKRKVTS